MHIKMRELTIKYILYIIYIFKLHNGIWTKDDIFLDVIGKVSEHVPNLQQLTGK